MFGLLLHRRVSRNDLRREASSERDVQELCRGRDCISRHLLRGHAVNARSGPVCDVNVDTNTLTHTHTHAHFVVLTTRTVCLQFFAGICRSKTVRPIDDGVGPSVDEYFTLAIGGMVVSGVPIARHNHVCISLI